MNITSRLWSPEQLKRINEDPALVSLLYDLNLLPEVISAHLRLAVEEERERCAKIAEGLYSDHFPHSQKRHAVEEVALRIRAS